MKFLKLLGFALFTIAMFIVSCDGGVSTKNNKFLGKVPTINKKYRTKLDKKEKAIEECTKIDEAFKLEKEKKLLKKEQGLKIAEYIKTSAICGKQIPLEVIKGSMFTLNKVMIDTVYSNGRVQFEFDLTINNDVKPQRFTPFVYFKAIDSQGNDIVGAKTVSAGNRSNIKPKSKITTRGILEAYLLEDFAKIIEITAEEYNKK